MSAPRRQKVEPAALVVEAKEHEHAGWELEDAKLDPTDTGGHAPAVKDSKPGGSKPLIPGGERDGQALRVELHLRMNLSELQDTYGPVTTVVENLKAELCAAGGIPPERLNFLDVRGEPVTLNLLELRDNATPSAALAAVRSATRIKSHARSKSRYENEQGDYPEIAALDYTSDDTQDSDLLPDALQDAAAFAIRKTIIDYEILPGEVASDPTPQMYLALMQEELRKKSGTLLTGTYGGLLEGATVLVGLQPRNQKAPPSPPHEEDKLEKAGSVGTSAGVASILVSLVTMLFVM